MKSKFLHTLLFVFTTFTVLLGTGDEKSYLNKKDSLFVQVATDNKKVFYHEVEAKQTLFGMSQFYGLGINRLYELNPHIQNKVMSLGANIMIPLPDRAIDKTVRKKGKGKFVPILYRVKPQENLFRIARVYFDLSVEDLKEMNKMKDNTLSINQVLIVGWLSIEGISKAAQMLEGPGIEEKLSILKPTAEKVKEDSEVVDNKVYTEDEILRKIENSEIKKEGKPKVYVDQKGIAFWNKSMRNSHRAFVLHKTAPINSIIEIVNPMFDKKVYAKVVGNIPPKAYTDDVILVVSPSVANSLGAMDPRFYVKIKYVK